MPNLSKLQNRQRKYTRIYLVFLDENSDKITLSFRSYRSLNKFINKHKIQENQIIHKSTKRPDHGVNPMESYKIMKVIGEFNKHYGHLFEEGVSE